MLSVKMAEGRLDREQKRLATDMNVPPVDENLYVKWVWNRDIPYEALLTSLNSQNSKPKQPSTQLSTFDSQNGKPKQPNLRHSKSNKQNSKAVRPKVLPTCCSLKDNYEQITTHIM